MSLIQPDSARETKRSPRQVDIVFVDETMQRHPSRPGMGPMVAVGGLLVPGGFVAKAERSLEELAQAAGFPEGEEFKWSPGRESWMATNLTGEARLRFFKEAVSVAAEVHAQVILVAEDTLCRTAAGDTRHLYDATRLVLERVNNSLAVSGTDGIVIADRPSGGRKEESQYLLESLETLRVGTEFVKFNRIALNVLTANSRFVRLLQLADVITASSLAFISGEDRHSPMIFERVRELIRRGLTGGQRGGTGCKLHPDYKYGNLYGWILGDSLFVRAGMGIPLPLNGRPYQLGPDQP